MSIECFINCHPPTRTAQQKGVQVTPGARRKLRFFKKTVLQQAENELKAHFMRYAPPAPLAGPLKITMTWTWDWFAYELPKRKKGTLPQWVPSVVDPDFDNIAKLFCDVLTKLGYWKDDAHISSATVQKGRGDRPGIHLRVEPWQQADWYVPPEGEVGESIDL